jgi:hypothetical protein
MIRYFSILISYEELKNYFIDNNQQLINYNCGFEYNSNINPKESQEIVIAIIDDELLSKLLSDLSHRMIWFRFEEKKSALPFPSVVFSLMLGE